MTMLGALIGLLHSAVPSFGDDAVDLFAPVIKGETPGIAFGITRYTGLMIDTFGDSSQEQPRVQLLCRSAPNAIEAGEAQAVRARAWMADKHDFTFDGTPIQYVRSTSGLTWLGTDAEGRGSWVCDFEITFPEGTNA